MNRLLTTFFVAVALIAVGIFAMRAQLSGPAHWTPDGLFYQSRALELAGVDGAMALKRTFEGAIAAELRQTDPTRSGDLKWARYHERFYERRVFVPYAASVIAPAAGDRALLDVSIAGYLAGILAIFGLLMVRFALPIAAAVTLLTIFLPMFTENSGFPQTDSWGLALEAGALAFGILALQRGTRWVVPWVLAILALSFTRDSAWIAIIAAGYLAFKVRSRLSFALLGSGIAAALPVALLFSVPTRELLATMLNNAEPNPDGSWGFILRNYPAAVVDTLHADAGFVLDGAWYSALYLLGGIALLFVLGRGKERSAATMFLQAAAFAGAAFVMVVPLFSALRLELAIVPIAAWGIALACERLAQPLALRIRIRERVA
jgi:hypothetical protein